MPSARVMVIGPGVAGADCASDKFVSKTPIRATNTNAAIATNTDIPNWNRLLDFRIFSLLDVNPFERHIHRRTASNIAD